MELEITKSKTHRHYTVHDIIKGIGILQNKAPHTLTINGYNNNNSYLPFALCSYVDPPPLEEMDQYLTIVHRVRIPLSYGQPQE